MNTHEWHLALNHIPVIGSLWTFALLLAALFRSSRTLLITGWVSTGVVVLAVLAASRTGLAAEAIINREPGISSQAITTHAALAQQALLPAAGALAAVILSWILLRRGHSVRTATVLPIIALGMMGWVVAQTAHSGGKIHRPELRHSQPQD